MCACGKEAHDAGLQAEAVRLAELRGPNYCGSCYGAEAPKSGCCNSCDEVREAYVRSRWSFAQPDTIKQCAEEKWSDRIREQNHEGCNIVGDIHVNKVVGNFHLSPGRAFQRNSVHTHELVPYLQGSGDEYHHFGHVIHDFSFGMDGEFPHDGNARRPLKQLLAINDPLKGRRAHTEESQFMFQYFLKVVPTEMHRRNGESFQTYQYSATSYERDLVPYDATKGHADPSNAQSDVIRGIEGVPGVFFNYEISPLRVIQRETKSSFTHFLTSTCAIVGGILTIAGLIDAAIYRSRRLGGVHDYADESLDDYGGKML